MTDPAEKIQLNTHGQKTRHFIYVKSTKPASKATKPMVAPAEKIRQVVEEMELEVEKRIPIAKQRVLDEEDRMGSFILVGYEAATEKWLQKLQEARSELLQQ